MGSFLKQTKRYLYAIMVIYIVLVATHKGEFWPFSIYPMFSQAGDPWTRVLIRDVSDTPDHLQWQPTNFDNLHGSPVALEDYGISSIDFSNFVTETDQWNLQRQQALRNFFDEQLGKQQLMIMKVEGRMIGQDSILTQATPLLMVTSDSIYTQPNKNN
jgi:hypothetical protein